MVNLYYSTLQKHRVILSALVIWCFSAQCDCRTPNYSDPDEFMDNIGKTTFCQKNDPGVPDGFRDNSIRENLGNGIANSNGGNNSEGGRATAIDYLGNVYIAGRTNGGNNDFLIMKYFPDGSLDTSFDTDGIATHSFGSSASDEVAHAITIHTNNAILVAGRSDTASAGRFDFAILRIASNGNLDTTFSTDGKQLVDVTGYADIARGIVLETNGRIVIAGYGLSSNYLFAIARLQTNGVLDTSFNTNGKNTIANGSSDNGALSVSLDSNGCIIAAGNSYNGSNWDFAAIRLLSSGSLDTTFKTTGKFTSGVGANDDVAYAVATDVLNGITLAGASNNGSNLDFGYIRLLTNGSLDTTFNTAGKKSLAVLSDDDVAYALSLETNGTGIVTAGYANNSSNNDFAVTRLKSNGSLDTSFYTNGKFTKAVKSNEDTAQGIFMKGDGYILVAGRTDTNGSGAYDVALMRIQSDGSLASSGSLVKSFGTSGTVTLVLGGSNTPYAITEQTDGKLVLSGSKDTSAAVLRVIDTGSFDTSFNTTGKKFIGTNYEVATSILINTDATILIAGADSNSDVFVARLLTNGNLDNAFAASGVLNYDNGGGYDSSYASALQTDGNIVLIGQDGNLCNITTLAMRITANGLIDTTFNTVGTKNFSMDNNDNLNVSYIQTDGRIIFAGSANDDVACAGAADNKTIISRFLTDGKLDTTFRTTGKFLWDQHATAEDYINSLALLEENKIITGGVYFDSRDIVRYLSDGRLDTSFNTNGIVLQKINNSSATKSIKSTYNSKYLASGSTLTGGDYDFEVSRYLSNGSIDTSFNTSGNNTTPFGTVTDIVSSSVVRKSGQLCVSGYSGASNWILSCYWP